MPASTDRDGSRGDEKSPIDADCSDVVTIGRKTTKLKPPIRQHLGFAMNKRFCKSCDEVVDESNFDRDDSDELMTGHDSGYCLDCFEEMRSGKISMVTDSSLPAPGTGLTMRQKLGQRQTDGG